MEPVTSAADEPEVAERPVPLAVPRSRWVEAAYLAAVAIGAVVLVLWALQLWRADLNVPFAYAGDSLPMGAIFKGLAENGTWWRNPAIGAPGGYEAYDTPFIAAWNQVVMRLLMLFAPAYPAAMNLFYLLGYPLAALVAAWALRRLGAGMVPAAVGGLLFAFMPYHFVRGENHILLSQYYLVPAALLLAIECASASPPVFSDRASATTFFGRSRPAWAIGVCVLIASCDVYYGFFSAMFIALACLYGLLRRRDRRYVWTAAVLLGAILAATLLNLAPALVYRAQHGSNTVGLARNPGQAEVYGLKLDQMLLPVDGHRVGKLAALKAAYHAGMQKLGPSLDNEAVTSSPLGVVAGVALLWLFGWAFVAFARGPDVSETGETLGRMGLLAVTAFVVATVGGLSAFVAFVVPQIRAYNRLSIYLAFLALAALAFGLERLGRRRGFAVMAAVSGVVLAAALLDQVSPAFVPDYAGLKQRFSADAAFVGGVQAQLPKGTAVLELPYMPFPEPGGPVVGIGEYEPIIPYLHSTTLRWSYGAMKGRPGDAEIQRISALPTAELPVEAKKAGYGALWLDTAGYGDRGASMERGLEAAGLRPLVTSPDGRYVVYRLGG